MITINYLAVLVAAIANFALGAAWYSFLFGKQWLRLMGFTPEKMESQKKGMAWRYGTMFASSLVMAYVLAHFAGVWNAADVMGAFNLAFWTWLGFIATVGIGSILWEGKSVQLYAINMGFYLASLFLMALILVFWK